MEKVQKPGYIAIEGCIGVGKTTLCNALTAHFKASKILEEVDNNPFLGDFYSDQASNAFKTQIFFLLSRYNQQKKLDQHDLFHPTVISDYFMAKDKLFAELNLEGHELGLYKELYDVLCNRVHVPDVLIYLSAPLEVILSRIETRGRKCEKDIDKHYLERLIQSYDTFFSTFTQCPVLKIETDRFNFPDSDDDVNCIVDFTYKTFHNRRSTTLGSLEDKKQPTLF